MTDVTPSSDPQLPPDWGRAMSEAAQGLLARVTFGDPHLDAKLFVYLLPHGTGSCRAEDGAGGLQQYAEELLTVLGPWLSALPHLVFLSTGSHDQE